MNTNKNNTLKNYKILTQLKLIGFNYLDAVDLLNSGRYIMIINRENHRQEVLAPFNKNQSQACEEISDAFQYSFRHQKEYNCYQKLINNKHDWSISNRSIKKIEKLDNK